MYIEKKRWHENCCNGSPIKIVWVTENTEELIFFENMKNVIYLTDPFKPGDSLVVLGGSTWVSKTISALFSQLTCVSDSEEGPASGICESLLQLLYVGGGVSGWFGINFLYLLSRVTVQQKM